MSTERDLPRLASDGSGAPPELVRALDAARARLPADALLAQVAARLPLGGGGPGGGDPGARPAGGDSPPGNTPSGGSSPGNTSSGGNSPGNTSSGGNSPGDSPAPGGGHLPGGAHPSPGGLASVGSALPVTSLPSIWSGVLAGAVAGALVGVASLFVPAGGTGPLSLSGAAAPAGAEAPLSAPRALSPAGPGDNAAPALAPPVPPAAGRAAAPGGVESPSGVASASSALLSAAGGAGGSGPRAPRDPGATSESGAAAGSGPAGEPGFGGEGESEVDYLRRAHAQLGASPARALALAEAYPARYPAGKLGQEREVIAINALMALGRTAEARARAQAFLARFPTSAHRRRVLVLVPDLAPPSP